MRSCKLRTAGNNYGNWTNEQFFDDHDWDFTKIGIEINNEAVNTPASNRELSGPDWARQNKVFSHIYFIFTGKDPGLTNKENTQLNGN